MGRVSWQERIVIAPDLHHGDPCVKGTRVPVATIMGSLAAGVHQDHLPRACQLAPLLVLDSPQ